MSVTFLEYFLKKKPIKKYLIFVIFLKMSSYLYFLIKKETCVVKNQSLNASYLVLKLILSDQIDLRKYAKFKKSDDTITVNILFTINQIFQIHKSV